MPVMQINRSGHVACHLLIDDATGPAAEDYVVSSLDKATQQQSEIVVIRMDTPDGLDSAMRGIIMRISNSSVRSRGNYSGENFYIATSQVAMSRMKYYLSESILIAVYRIFWTRN